MEVCRLIEEELGIDRSRIRPCFDQSRSRVSCLVSETTRLILTYHEITILAISPLEDFLYHVVIIFFFWGGGILEA